MANINVTIRIDEDLKEEADQLFDDLGMSFTTAISNVFVKQSLREGRIPFEITKTPRMASFDHSVVSLSDSQR